MTERYVVLGLAPARSAWFRTVARWANDGSLAIQFVKCVSVAELRAHLTSARRFSALIVDAATPGIDRDLIDDARTEAIAVLVVDDGSLRDWAELGASAVLAPAMSRDELMETITRTAAPVGDHAHLPGDLVVGGPALSRAPVTAVCGTGGAGASTIAMAVAQALGDDPELGGMVLLVDAARRAEQAMLHDAGDVVPGIQDLVEAHRTGRPTLDQVRAATFGVPARHYDLLLGLRRPHHWSTLRPRAVEATFDSLRRAWRAVVVDTDGDAEPAALGGSDDVARRTTLTRTALVQAERVLVVGAPSTKGIFSLAQLLHELLEAGIDAGRIVPVVNRAPRTPPLRAALARTLASLGPAETAFAAAGPVFVPEHRRLDATIADVARLPRAVVDPVRSIMRLKVEEKALVPEPEPVMPGTIGSWVETA